MQHSSWRGGVRSGDYCVDKRFRLATQKKIIYCPRIPVETTIYCDTIQVRAQVHTAHIYECDLRFP